MVFGGFSAELAGRLQSALMACAPEPVSPESVAAQFEGTPLTDAVVADVNRGTVFYRPSARAHWWMADIADEIAEQVAAFIGSPWRILGSRAWQLSGQSGDLGANEWHVDGLPESIAKLMIFPHAVGPDQGTTEFQFADGQTLAIESAFPTWALFKSSELMHRGVRPSGDTVRYVAELTILPSPRFDLNPVFAGNNARHPLEPWFRSAGYRF